MLEGMNKYGSPPPHYRLRFSLVLAVGRSYARPHTMVISTPAAAPKHLLLVVMAMAFPSASVSWLLWFLVDLDEALLAQEFLLAPSLVLEDDLLSSSLPRSPLVDLHHPHQKP